MVDIPESEHHNHTLDDKTWKIDKRIPLALIFVFICQTLGVVWAAAQLSAEVKNLRDTTVRLENRIDVLGDKLDSQQSNFVSRTESDTEREFILQRLRDLDVRVRDLERVK